MGSGKSTVGQVLAEVLSCGRMDTDVLFEQVHGPISDYFTAHGEPAFRWAEEYMVGQALSSRRPAVLSLGGGAVLSARTRVALGDRADVVYLQVSEDEALARLGGGEGRPVLAGDPGRTWRRILSERDALYREVATWTVDTTGLSAADVAAAIADLLAGTAGEAPTLS